MGTLQGGLSAIKDSVAATAIDIFQRIATFTADDLDRMGSLGETLIASGVPYTSDMKIPDVEGGWKIIFAGVKEEGRFGKLILLPNSQWAESLWRKGQIYFIAKYRLTEQQQAVWTASYLKNKHDTVALDRLASVLNTPRLLSAYLTYNHKSTRDESMMWDARNGINHRIHPIARRALAELVDEMYHAGVCPELEGGPAIRGAKARPARGDVGGKRPRKKRVKPNTSERGNMPAIAAMGESPYQPLRGDAAPIAMIDEHPFLGESEA